MRWESRVTYDLPTALRNQENNLSNQLKIPASRLSTLALELLIKDYQNGPLDLPKYKEPSCSPHYDWILNYTEEMYLQEFN